MNIRGKGSVYRVKLPLPEEKAKKKNIMKERGAKRESGGRGWGGAVCDDGSTRLTPFPLRPITTGFELFLRGLHSEMIFSIYYFPINYVLF